MSGWGETEQERAIKERHDLMIEDVAQMVKQEASKLGAVIGEIILTSRERGNQARADADQRLALLREVEHEFENLGKCLICHSSDKMDGKLWHADGCELDAECNG